MNNLESIAKMIEERVNCKEVKIEEITKINDTRRVCVNIFKEGSCIAPAIYIEHMIGESSDEDIVDYVVEIYKHEVENGIDNISAAVNGIYSYEKIKDYLGLRLMNLELNRHFLKDIQYKKFLDLAAVVYIELDAGSDAEYGVKVNNELLNIWGMAFDDVYQYAFENTIRPNIVIRSLDSIFNDVGFNNDPTNFMSKTYMVTNKKGINGSDVMLNEQGLKDFLHYMEWTKAIVIPSSVHEILLMEYDELNASFIDEMIRDVNRLEVRDNEILSDHHYIFSLFNGWEF